MKHSEIVICNWKKRYQPETTKKMFCKENTNIVWLKHTLMKCKLFCKIPIRLFSNISFVLNILHIVIL